MTVYTLQKHDSYSWRATDAALAAPGEAVEWTEPGTSRHEALVLRKLGSRGWGRLYQFMHLYGPHWGEHGHRPLSPKALASFHVFLEAMQFPEAVLPSVFLTDHGHLELCWEDARGKAVQVEFGPASTTYFVEATDTEGQVAPQEAAALARELSR